MRTALALAAVGLLATVWMGAADRLAADPAPPASQPEGAGAPLGRITGRLRPASIVAAVKCLDREYRMTYPVRWDAAAGQFSVGKLATGRRYDLEVTTTDGKTFIGVDMSWKDDPLLRLARRQADPDEPPGPLTDDDRRQIDDIVVKIEAFTNDNRILALRGDHDRACGLVELRRTTPFHGGKAGEQIRRVELWYFKFQHGGWEKIANAEKILSRVRADGPQIERDRARQVYLPELGGILLEPSNPDATVDVDLPGCPASQPTSSANEGGQANADNQPRP